MAEATINGVKSIAGANEIGKKWVVDAEERSREWYYRRKFSMPV